MGEAGCAGGRWGRLEPGSEQSPWHLTSSGSLCRHLQAPILGHAGMGGAPQGAHVQGDVRPIQTLTRRLFPAPARLPGFTPRPSSSARCRGHTEGASPGPEVLPPSPPPLLWEETPAVAVPQPRGTLGGPVCLEGAP